MDFTSLIDLAAARTGGRALQANDEFFAPKANLLKAGKALWIADKYTAKGKWMDGWETRRRRTPGNDWIIVALGARGTIGAVELDTAHYKGNYPDSFSLQAADLAAGLEDLDTAIIASAMFWPELLAPQKLNPDAIHKFDKVHAIGPVTHVRLNIFPDGGVSRLRLFGQLAE